MTHAAASYATYLNTINIDAILILIVYSADSLYSVRLPYFIQTHFVHLFWKILRLKGKLIDNVDELIFVVCSMHSIVYYSACHPTLSQGFEDTDTGDVVCYFEGKLKWSADRIYDWWIDVNIRIIFYCIGNSRWCIYNNLLKSDWLLNTQSRVLQADIKK